MTRPARPDRPIRRTLYLPESLDNKIQLLLWSELEGRVPFGEFSRFITELVETALARNATATKDQDAPPN